MQKRTKGRLGALAALLGLGLAGFPAAAGPVAAPPGQVSAFFFGDSLMAGTGTNPRRPAMARIAGARLGWDVDVDAWGGTGYTTTGRSPGYLQRLRRPGAMPGRYDVVLLEGGTNDARNAGDPQAVEDAVLAVLGEVRRRQPQATIVLMGAYDPPPPGRTDPRRRIVDGVVAGVAKAQGIRFFSPLSGRWTVGQPPSFLYTDRLHPSARGYGVMGSRLAEELADVDLAGRSSQAPQSTSSAA